MFYFFFEIKVTEDAKKGGFKNERKEHSITVSLKVSFLSNFILITEGQSIPISTFFKIYQWQ